MFAVYIKEMRFIPNYNDHDPLAESRVYVYVDGGPGGPADFPGWRYKRFPAKMGIFDILDGHLSTVLQWERRGPQRDT